VLHPLATIVAALLADSARVGPCRGSDFLAALVAGVDVAVALGLAATSPLKFFRPATAGIFGSVAALARLRRLDRAAALDALGYALAFASGTMQAHVEGKPALPVQVANAARGAVAALDMALAGLSGPLGSVDGPFGYLPLFETAFDMAPVIADLGRVFRVSEISWKPFPTGRAAHGAITAIEMLLRDHPAAAQDLESLTYRAPPLIARLVGRKTVPDMTPAYARLCLPYLAAVTLTSGTVGLGDFSGGRLADPELLALAGRITVTVNEIADPAAFVPGLLIARFTGGRSVEIPVTSLLGSPAWKLTPEQHRAKAASCLAFADLSACDQPLADGIAGFADLEDVAALWALIEPLAER
jgi:2-methylcitrate dehydratase PrpD